MKEQLAKCPFCGSEPYIGSLGGDKENWAIFCNNDKCQASCVETEEYDNWSKQAMIDRWNRRVS